MSPAFAHAVVPMDRMGGRRDAQPRPDGKYYAITDEWRSELKDKLAARGRGAKARLAEAIGASPAAITVILRDETKGSRYVEPISAAFEIPLPSITVRTDLDMRWMIAGQSLDQDDYEMLLRMAEKLAANNS